jgi:hypothetical protein
MHIRVLEDEEQELPENEPQIPFDRFVMRACKTLLAISDEATPFPSSKPVRPKATAVTTLTADSISEGSDSSAATRRNANGRGKKSKNPLRSDTVFPPRQKAPSGHTLRTLLAGVGRRATVLTNNRGAVHKVLREVGVPEGIPDDTRYEHARIWVVNPSSLAEWRRLQVEESAARVGQVEGPSS